MSMTSDTRVYLTLKSTDAFSTLYLEEVVRICDNQKGMYFKLTLLFLCTLNNCRI